ncbi:MAG: protein kinase [Acidobacteriota bacterium]
MSLDASGEDSKDALRIPEDLAEDPNLSYNPTRSTLLGRSYLPTSFPTAPAVPASAATPSPAASSTKLPTGDRLELREPLAKGGFGDIWIGIQESLDRRVAIKRLREDRVDGASDAECRELERMFRQEALTTARLEHPNIVPVYQLGSDTDGRPLLGMKLVRGQPWSKLLRADRDQPVNEFLVRHLPILIDVAQAVAFAHSKGVLHRDLKPQQVMVGEFGEVLLMDWGLASTFPTAETHGASLSADPADSATSSLGPPSQGAAGTPSFMAPEQARGEPNELGPWTDLYLLGGILYYLLTGSPPHKASSGADALTKAARGEITRPSAQAPDRSIPGELEELVMGILRPDPVDRRPGDALGFIAAVQAYVSGASRRQRSRALTSELSESAAPLDYSDFSRHLSRLQEARALWHDNPQIAPLQRDALAAYAEAALAKRDLTLARLQAEQLPAGSLRDELLRRIEAAVSRRQALARQRRFALRGVAALGLMLVAGGIFYLVEQRRAGDRLLHQRDAARQARADAEGLMTFMLEDLWWRLREIERIELLAPVARRAEAYYSTRDPAEMSIAERLNRGAAFSTIGQTLQAQGEIEAAIAAHHQAAEVFRLLHEQEPDVPEHQLGYLAALAEAAQGLNDIGDKDAAILTYGEVREACLRALARRPHDGDLELLLLRAHDGAGVALYDQGELAKARQAFAEAAEIAQRRWQTDPHLDHAVDLGEIRLRLAVALHESGEIDAASREIERAVELVEEARRQAPGQDALLFTVGFARSVWAEMLSELGEIEKGARMLRELMPEMHRLAAEDPENAEWRYVLAEVELTFASLEQARGRDVAARAAWQRVVNLLAPFRDHTDNGYLLDRLVRALLQLNRVDEARPVALGLLEKDWSHRDFVELCREYGIALGD